MDMAKEASTETGRPGQTGSDTRPLSDKEKAKVLNVWRQSMMPWRKIRHTMPLQYLHTFALVAVYEGRSVQEYSELAKVGQTVMSRHLLDLGARNRHLEPGFGLIEARPARDDLRRHEMYLTREGRALRDELAEILAHIADVVEQ
jgi:DNA-binding MarR family transcriptional regulator